MSRRGLTRGRLLVLLVSTAASVLAGWVFLRAYRPAPQTVDVIDTTAEIIELLERRRLGADASQPDRTDADWPPPLVREPLDEATAAIYFPGLRHGKRHRYDPVAYFLHHPNWTARMKWAEHPDGEFRLRTNAQGLHEDEDVPATAAGLRILVAGDSHIAGVCNNVESFPNVLEQRLADDAELGSVDVVNAAQGGYGPHNYLGTIERFGELAPDVFVMVVYGGNDFSSMMVLQRHFERRRPPRGPLRKLPVGKGVDGIVPQELQQALFFHSNEEDIAIAVGTIAAITVEVRERCRELGARLVCVYLPPPSRGQPAIFEAQAKELMAGVEIGPESLSASDFIADRWLEWLELEGVAGVDLRPVFRRVEEPLYWDGDKHINVRAHALIAEAVDPIVRELLAR